MKLNGLEALYQVLNQDGFIGFIEGRKDKGKTDISLLVAELCYLQGLRTHIATNIWTESYMVEAQITNIPDAKQWLLKVGRKLYILDEMGRHTPRMGFMTKKNQAIMELVQLIRHYDAGFIGIAPAQRFIDSGFLDRDVIDFIIHKYSREYGTLWLASENRYIELNTIPKTSIKFNSKDIADFTLEKKVNFQGLPLCCQVAAKYAETGSYDIIEQVFKLKREQIRRKMREHCLHSTSHESQPLSEVKSP